MATVRISQALRDQIYRNATNAFDKTQHPPKMDTDSAMFMINAAKQAPAQVRMREINQTIAAAKQEFGSAFQFNEVNAFNECTYDEGENIRFKIKVDGTSEHVNVPAPETVKLLFGERSYYGFKTVSVDHLREDDRSRAHNICLSQYNAMREYGAKRDKYTRQTAQLLERCTTLKQLINAWPQIKAFVPEHALAKMNQKVNRPKPKEVTEELEFDSDLATGVAVAAKLTGALNE